MATMAALNKRFGRGEVRIGTATLASYGDDISI